MSTEIAVYDALWFMCLAAIGGAVAWAFIRDGRRR